MLKIGTVAVAGFILIGMTGISQARAESTPWLLKSDFNQHLKTRLNGGKVIPTGFNCRMRGGRLQLKLSYRSLSSGPKPFHKWNWVIASEEDLSRAVAALRRSDRPDLKYHVVFKDSFVATDSKKSVCAIAFR